MIHMNFISDMLMKLVVRIAMITVIVLDMLFLTYFKIVLCSPIPVKSTRYDVESMMLNVHQTGY